MNKAEFQQLFLDNVRQALGYAEQETSRHVSDEFDVELHGAGISGEIISPVRAVDLMYVGEDRFYRIIDIGVKAVIKDRAVVFVRISDHHPSSFRDTWNTPKGNGPFKVIEPANIQVKD